MRTLTFRQLALPMKSLIAQILVLLIATVALTEFYLSYQAGDFAKPFVSIGLILILPWLVISLMPVMFVLDASELRREIVLQQFLMAVIVLVLLSGLAVYYGFHSEILAQVQQFSLKAVSFFQDILEKGVEAVKVAYDFAKNLYANTIAPLFN